MMPINPELLDQLLKEYKSPEDMFGTDGLLQQLTKALVERAMQAELTHHLGYEKHAADGDNSGNSRNGSFPKTINGKRGQMQINVPRDRAGDYQPQLIKKGQTRFDGFDDKIISMYSRGMTGRFRPISKKSMASRFHLTSSRQSRMRSLMKCAPGNLVRWMPSIRLSMSMLWS
jgi:putative transposase